MFAPEVTIVDYGMGNLHSVAKAFEASGARTKISSDPDVVARASVVVLPGVGAFPDGMRRLKTLGLIDAVAHACRAGKPFLGICLGLQMLFESSEEFGGETGLGVLKGQVRKIPQDGRLKIPHMGWNRLNFTAGALSQPVWQGIQAEDAVYFVHSYHVCPTDKAVIAATTDYGSPLVAAVQTANLVATQFHPEKSQNIGLRFLQNFTTWSAKCG